VGAARHRVRHATQHLARYTPEVDVRGSCPAGVDLEPLKTLIISISEENYRVDVA
jgi:hypothetical protein